MRMKLHIFSQNYKNYRHLIKYFFNKSYFRVVDKSAGIINFIYLIAGCFELTLTLVVIMKIKPLKISLFAVAMLCACVPKDDHDAEELTANVTISVAREVLYNKRVNSSGRLTPISEVKLSFKTGGIINLISVREGQVVNRGDIMASLNMSEISSHMRQAELGYEKALRDFERVKNLYEENAATLENYQNARTALEIAESAKVIAQFNLEHSIIKAPSDGKIMKVMAEEDEIIAPGHPVLLFASSQDQWLLRVPVTDRDIVDIDEGDNAEVTFDAYPGDIFHAHIYEIAGMANPHTGTFEVSLAVSSDDKRLLTGFIGKASLITSRTYEYTEIPAEALLEASGREGTVFRFTRNTAVRERVTIEVIAGNKLLVNGGVSPGDTIIREGAAFVSDGQRVVIYE
ncbi:MAG: efflux RND transporter periplasmic adaptor subunit [Marinilabiliales bacterium]|nr:MAG: efflux RND transporter periplasmic adaptor subunit [Marinilabiliales bacterium]